MTTDAGTKHPASSSPPSKDTNTDKKQTDQCLVSLEPANGDDIFKCMWCKGRQHRLCSKISVDHCNV